MCRGQPCTITRHTFTWSNKLITSATGSMPDPNNPGRTLTEDVLKDLENTMLPTSESGFVLKRIHAKAEEQARRKLGRRIEIGPGPDELTLVESGCGEEGTCQCIALKGAEPVTLEPAEMTFPIDDLYARGLQPAVGWETFSITVTAMVVTTITEGRCFPRRLRAF